MLPEFDNMQLFFDILIAIASLMLTAMAAIHHGRRNPANSARKTMIDRAGLVYILLATALSVVIIYKSVLLERYRDLDKQQAADQTSWELKDFGLRYSESTHQWLISDTLKYRGRLK